MRVYSRFHGTGLASNVVTNVYDVQDLIMSVTDFDQRRRSTFRARSLAVAAAVEISYSSRKAAPTRQQLVDRSKQLIQDTVARTPDGQQGKIGSIANWPVS